MKSELIPYVEENEKQTYPYMGRLISDMYDMIILFSERNTGVVIYKNGTAGNPSDVVGTYSTDWLEKDRFDPYTGKMVLEND